METPYQWWMDRLLRVAAQAGNRGEVPVAAVVLDPRGRAIGWGSNRREGAQDPLGHAELVALSQASALRHDWRFNQHTLIVTLEPCPMCAGALVQARMGRVVYGASDPKRGALGVPKPEHGCFSPSPHGGDRWCARRCLQFLPAGIAAHTTDHLHVVMG